MKIKCLIVDDEPPAREVLRNYISNVDALELAGECPNAVEAINFLQIKPVDLLFLDILMPHLLGTSFIRTLKHPPKIIFTTAFRKFAVEGFELNAIDYLVKPIAFDRFLQGVNKVLENVSELAVRAENNELSPTISHPFLYFRVNRKMLKVYLEDILFIESLKDYVKVVTSTKTIITKQPISGLEEILPNNIFLRIHRSFIVAVKKIESFNAESVEIGKTEIPIGRSFKHDISRTLNIR